MFHALAETANRSLTPIILNTLATSGRAAYFPKQGILGQSAEAKTCGVNATIGIALEESGKPMCLGPVADMVALPSETLVPYAPSYGLPELRTYWLGRLREANPDLGSQNISKPITTCALTHALSVAGKLLLEPGRTLILPDLFWGNYRLIFEQGCGAKIVTYPTFLDGGFNVAGCLETVRAQAPGPCTVLLNFPNNPTGYTCTEMEARALSDGLGAVARERGGLSVMIDDAYFGLNYDPSSYTQSVFALLAQADEHLLAVKIDGATKEDYVWGFRVGFLTFGYRGATATALAALEDKCAGIVRGSISNAPRISQSVLLAAVKDDAFRTEKLQKYALLKTRYAALMDCFASTDGFEEQFELLPANAGYFLCVRPLGVDAELLRQTLITDYDVGVIATSGLIRIAFSSVPTAQIPKLVGALAAAHGRLRSADG